MVTNKTEVTFEVYRLSKSKRVAMNKSLEKNNNTNKIRFVVEKVDDLKTAKRQVTNILEGSEESKKVNIPLEKRQQLEYFFDTSLPTITLREIMDEKYSDEYYATRYLKVLPRTIEEVVIRNAQPDTTHNVKWHHQHYVSVTDDHEAKLFFDYQIQKAKPYSILKEEMLIEGGIAREGRIVPKITYHWLFAGNYSLPPLFSDKWYAFKWEHDGILWKFGINQFKLIYKPEEKMIRIEFDYFCSMLDESVKWNKY